MTKRFGWSLTILLVIKATPVRSGSLEDFSPHFSNGIEIVWTAPTNHLPKTLWIYEKTSSKLFSPKVVSNAVALASLQNKGIPQTSTREFCLDLDTCPCGHPCTFEISPSRATLSFASLNFRNGSSENVPSAENVEKRAWECATLLRLDATQLAQKHITTNFCEYDQKGRLATNNSCGRGITLSRRIDGIDFCGNDLVEGFFIELGSQAQIRFFSLVWPDLKRRENSQIATPAQIIACIRAFKTPLLPEGDENYLAHLKTLANARKLTITRITPYYGEGEYGKTPEGNESPKLVTPVAQLDGFAELGITNMSVTLYSPILSSEINRLLNKK